VGSPASFSSASRAAAKILVSRRTLALTAELLTALRQHHARQAEARIAAGALWRDHGLIFTTEIGTPIDPESFAHTFSRLCKKAGLGHWHPTSCVIPGRR
jgi:hypothetical protein